MQEKMRYYAQSQQEMEEDRRQVVHLAEELRSAKSEMATCQQEDLRASLFPKQLCWEGFSILA